ncbi:MAG: hypothetical protein LBQ79_13795 [Deltaproteobacteria bacterium]|jgi:hypothetical protein|nr:hypothetical protein [Deltaproteobacteria bacterium]
MAEFSNDSVAHVQPQLPQQAGQQSFQETSPSSPPSAVPTFRAACREASELIRRTPLPTIFFPVLPSIYLLYALATKTSGLTSATPWNIILVYLHFAIMMFSAGAVAAAAANPELKPSQWLKASGVQFHRYLLLTAALFIFFILSFYIMNIGDSIAVNLGFPRLVGTVPGALLVTAGFFALFLPICLTVPVMAVEKKRLFPAISRSMALTRGNRLNILDVSVTLVAYPAVSFFWTYFSVIALQTKEKFSWTVFISKTVFTTIISIAAFSILAIVFLRLARAETLQRQGVVPEKH